MQKAVRSVVTVPVLLSDERLDAVLEILTAIEERVSRQKTRQE